VVHGTDEFDEWFLALHPRVLVAAQRLLGDRAEAEDVVAEAFARALVRWSRIGRLDHRDAWVFRVAVNGALDALRRRPRRSAAEPPERATDVAATELRLVLTEALRRLSRRQREAVVLRYVGGLSEREVAEALDVSVETARTHLKRGLAALRADMTLREEEVRHALAGG
jgi:RNA polymerase sigma-70 factor (sigma-E family)